MCFQRKLGLLRLTYIIHYSDNSQ